ncbi:plectin [Spirillospora sp. NPDC029432]|uniref:plectin n=1 Tax=Spirillospora sp. NPDC029432 TaxID=3154599 RepID=UPI0034539EAC
MPLGRRMSKDVAELIEADQVLAGTYRDRLAEATEAEGALRAAQEADPSDAGPRAEAVAFDEALTAALLAAEAAERVAAGRKAYAAPGADAGTRRAAEIALRKAKARPAVRPWTAEVDRLRTAREAHRLSFRTAPAVAR